MTFFPALRATSSDIGGAVAEAVLHDIRVNSLGLEGFPQITVLRPDKNSFEIELQFNGHRQGFTLSNDEAKAAVKMLKANKGYDPNIFERIQDSLAKLEATTNNSYKSS